MSTSTEPATEAAAAPAAAVPAPSPAPAESAADLLRDLARFYTEGKLEIRLNYGRLKHMDSPVGVEADSNIWAYGVIVVMLAAAWFGGWKAGVAIFVLGTLAYFTIGRHYVHRRMEKRIETTALTDVAVWQKLWRFGGLTLAALEPGAAEPCPAPGGNWLAFVRQLRAAEVPPPPWPTW
jgi:hypothetical protein